MKKWIDSKTNFEINWHIFKHLFVETNNIFWSIFVVIKDKMCTVFLNSYRILLPKKNSSKAQNFLTNYFSIDYDKNYKQDRISGIEYKNPVKHLRQDFSENIYQFSAVNYFRKKLHLRCEPINLLFFLKHWNQN